MTNQDKLSSLASEFQQWRLTRQYPREKTPQQLKDKTVALAQYYSSSQIKTALNIADSTFHHWCKQATSVKKPSEFIAVPDELNASSDEFNITLTCKNGNRLQLSGPLSPALLAVITGALLV
ncbi:hypothetical protein [Moritella yayanosii]|uniref:Transposase n=1 Tax=Moritella yayanosii TaxID=69539 RepID=A0A330LUD3_9GAMM|nr:hypothetical protein [Moritella yayanosii]SQD77590.1 conserved protein of unknown function [Moritella yayanosii]SQD79591.1 conserved protein of unknown function [Moritella yayanosii]SQD80717.1 conserved protein of unknown function [Moritella yayanosii]